jgi:hypothetical protein
LRAIHASLCNNFYLSSRKRLRFATFSSFCASALISLGIFLIGSAISDCNFQRMLISILISHCHNENQQVEIRKQFECRKVSVFQPELQLRPRPFNSVAACRFFVRRTARSTTHHERSSNHQEMNMLSSHMSENRSGTTPTALHSSSMEAGRQRQGRLWSNLKEVCELLHVTSVGTINDEELLFQHVQFKTGQRIHTIGQTFDTRQRTGAELPNERRFVRRRWHPYPALCIGSGSLVQLRLGIAAIQEIHCVGAYPC